MNSPAPLPYLKCAAPTCRSAARDGDVCSFHKGTIFADRTLEARRFRVVAIDPEHRSLRPFIVRALSPEQAEAAARVELVREGREHWPVKIEGAW